MKNIIIITLLIIACVFSYMFFAAKPGIKNSNPISDVIVCFGDSLTYGTGAAQDKDYPSQLSNLLGRDIINAGVPGDTTAMALARLEKDVLSHNPGIVLITLGGNDLMRGIAKKEAFSNLKTIIIKIQEQGAMVVVGGIKFAFLDRGFAKEYEELCEETAALYVPNILGGIMDDESLMSDRIHPNSAGYAIVAEKFYKKMKPYLN